MMYKEEREKLCRYTKSMFDRKLTNAAGGNVSVKVSEEHYIMTPSFMSQAHLCDLVSEQILVIDKEGNILEGDGKVTREFNMHMVCYEENEKVGCVIHAHPLDSMVFATLGMDMPNLSEASEKLGEIKCLEYAPSTSTELAEKVREELKKANRIPQAFLLKRHGILLQGDNIEKTYDMVERLEWNAHIAINYLLFNKKADIEMDLD